MYLCPYCLRVVKSFQEKSLDNGKNVFQCCPYPDCEQPMPVQYLQNYESYFPVIVSLMGLPTHGKTTYLTSLLSQFGRLGKQWRNFSYRSLDSAGWREILERVKPYEAGEPPESTEKMFPRPVILQLEGLPKVGRCRLLMYDTGGEVFEQVPDLKEYGAYTTRSRCVVWLVSLAQLASPLDLADLLHVYLDALAELKGDPKKQRLLVVLAKGDLLRARPAVPASMQHVLDQEGDAEPGLDKMEELSHAIEAWLEAGDYYNFVRVARNAFDAVRYCTVWAWRDQPPEETKPVPFAPRGVLLPLFWVVALNSRQVVQHAGTSYFSLEWAVRRAPAGATLVLGASRYALAEPLRIDRPLRLEGRGAGHTQIVSTAEGYGIRYDGAGLFAAEGIAFEHRGRNAANVFWAAGGVVGLRQCRFSGAAGDNADPRGGCGLLLTGNVSGVVSQCEFVNNRFGILLDDAARPTLEDNACGENAEADIAYHGSSAGVARKNHSLGETPLQLRVADQAHPTLEQANVTTGQPTVVRDSSPVAGHDETAADSHPAPAVSRDGPPPETTPDPNGGLLQPLRKLAAFLFAGKAQESSAAKPDDMGGVPTPGGADGLPGREDSQTSRPPVKPESLDNPEPHLPETPLNSESEPTSTNSPDQPMKPGHDQKGSSQKGSSTTWEVRPREDGDYP